MIDLREPEFVDIIFDGLTIWVNVDGICRLRVVYPKDVQVSVTPTTSLVMLSSLKSDPDRIGIESLK